MTGVLRSWHCMNARCGAQFDAWEPYPECPQCHGVRVEWVPGGGHVAGTAPAADAELRTLADTFGLTDLNSARRDQRAKPALPRPVGDAQPAMQFAPGYAATPYVLDKQGKPHAVCMPSMQRVNFKATVATGVGLPHSRTVPGVHAGTRIEARHKP